MADNTFVTLFTKDERQARQDCVCSIMKDENAPLDIAYKINISKVQREYYPCDVFGITCEGSWTGTSIWEHEEEYQVAKDVIVYIDHNGKEHRSQSYETVVTNGHSRRVQMRPVSKTEYETKKRVIIDNTEQTSGYIERTKVTQPIWTGPLCKGQDLIEWIDESRIKTIGIDELNDGVVISEDISHEVACRQAKEKVKGRVGRHALSQAPGNRCENFEATIDYLEIEQATVYVGVYHVFYDYNGKEYDCFIGGDEGMGHLLGEYPIDENLKSQNTVLEKQDYKQYMNRFWFLIGAFVAFLATAYSLMFSSVVVFPIACTAFVFFIIKFLDAKKYYRKLEDAKNSISTGNSNIKDRIFKYIQDDSISPDEKKGTIEKWLLESESERNAAGMIIAESKKRASKVYIGAGVLWVVLFAFSYLVFGKKPIKFIVKEPYVTEIQQLDLDNFREALVISNDEFKPHRSSYDLGEPASQITISVMNYCGMDIGSLVIQNPLTNKVTDLGKLSDEQSISMIVNWPDSHEDLEIGVYDKDKQYCGSVEIRYALLKEDSVVIILGGKGKLEGVWYDWQ